MSRRRSMKRRRAREAQTRQSFEETLKEIMESPGPMNLGMKANEARLLIDQAVKAMARHMSEQGLTGKLPWTNEAYDPRSLRQTLDIGYAVLQRGEQVLDATPEGDLTEHLSEGISADMVGGILTIAAVCELWLRSQPMPYKLARYFISREIEGGVDAPASPGTVRDPEGGPTQ